VADVAQLVEHSLGKGEVTSSILVIGSRDFAQVAERLMAADCKSAAPWSYGGSNPPLCTRKQAEMTAERRFYVALALYAVLAVLVWTTLGYSPVRIQGREVDLRIIPSLILGMFAVRTILFRQAERVRSKEKD
jgi:hypothetical protein